MSYINVIVCGNEFYFEIKLSKSKGMQKKNQTWVLGKPRDAKQWPSGRNFLSAPHTYVRLL